MKINFIIYSLCLFCVLSCTTDPNDPCPDENPPFEVNVIGTWDYYFSDRKGRIQINEDGTFEDIENQFFSMVPSLPNGTWRVENEALKFRSPISPGVVFGSTMFWSEYDCDSFLVDGDGFSNVPFIRV